MTATTEPPPRILTLDFLRGIAVMGILAMNIIAFTMPFQAYGNPTAYGGSTGADLWAWIIPYIFVEGKMRAMFSLLFGASMLLVIQKAEASGRPGGSVHASRMLWLLGFGLAHFVLIWMGDILFAYALIGLVAYLFTGKTERQLKKWAIIFLLIGLLVYTLVFVSPLLLQMGASAPNGDPQLVRQWTELQAQMGRPTPAMIAEDLAIHRGSYLDLVQHRVKEQMSILVFGVFMFGPETLGLMLLGMWGLRTGFLTGEWETPRYARVAAICLGIALPAYALIAYAIVRSGFDVGPTLSLGSGLASVFRPIMTLGYAALILCLINRRTLGALGQRVAAAGRAAFTNYLGTSIVATFIFYGWGLGYYGRIGRAESYLVVLGIWALMLLWSKPWLDRYRYGPLEWAWRSLSRGKVEPMRRLEAAPASAE